jgi:hypothetical protein
MWKRTWKDTMTAIGIRNWRKAVRSVVFVALTLVCVHYIGGQAQMNEELLWTAGAWQL